MKDNIPEEIQEALTILVEAEKNKNLIEKIRDFEQGFEIIDQYLEDIDKTNADLEVKIKKYKKSYARALLSQLPICMSVDVTTWFDYTKILMFKIKDEIEEIEKENPKLKENRKNFIDIWRKEIIEILNKDKTN